MTEKEIIDTLIEKCRKVKDTVKEEHKKLPIIYPTIKMHKNPVKFRFIIAAREGVIKNIAKKLTKILQLVINTHKKYFNKILLLTGINRMWIIENTKNILNDIENTNKKKNAKNIATYDFSTLYTKIPLEDLKEKLKWMIDKAFKGGRNQYINIRYDKTTWSDKEYERK